uniref:Uncharacterized protein n=1 Tax=Anguilla anguilla TaxID=7936 RepID=A0A0E9UDI1_ANGAN
MLTELWTINYNIDRLIYASIHSAHIANAGIGLKGPIRG